MALIRNTEDFRREFGPGPTLPPVEPAERLRQLGIENIPTRLRWLAMHPRLLALAYFLRPSWQPDLRMYRIVAADQTPMFTKRDGARQKVITVLSTRSQELRLGHVLQRQSHSERVAEMPPDHRRQMVNALRRLDQEAGWAAPFSDLEEMLP